MITKLHLSNYKTHSDTSLDLSNLTILTGLNGMGKSSILQSLLLLRQSFFQNKDFEEGLVLNGDLVEIGTGQDAVCSTAETNDFGFSLAFTECENTNFRFIADVHTFSNDVLLLDREKSVLADNLKNEHLFSEFFQYISAEHIEPKENHPRSTRIVEIGRQISHKKGRGEYAVHYLSHFGSNATKRHADIISVLPAMRHPSTDSDSLVVQVNAWLGEISPGVAVSLSEDVNNNNFTLRFKFERTNEYSKAYKPQNVGFGISYALPIILALLAMPSTSGLVLLENPEAHIHPQGQAKLAELIARAAQAGAQVIVETHSDHIVNGTLVAIKKHQKASESERHITGIALEKVNMYYINRPKGENGQIADTATATKITITEKARTRNTPEGFFDQFSKDLNFLIGV